VTAVYAAVQTGCDVGALVCGLDGNTYQSECSAWAAGVPVDYTGHCVAVGQHICQY